MGKGQIPGDEERAAWQLVLSFKRTAHHTFLELGRVARVDGISGRGVNSGTGVWEMSSTFMGVDAGYP
jgi:hypothetical protein